MQTTVQLFILGQIVATPNALAQVPPQEIQQALARHMAGDWGDVDQEDHRENDFSLGKNLRLFSVYRAGNGIKFWIITEADRSSTAILLPEDY